MTLEGSAETRFGASLASLDVNGDGFSDVLVGSPSATGAQPAVSMFRGTGAGIGTTAARRWTSMEDGSGFGTSLRSIGDIDRDGYGDWLVGAPGAARTVLYLGATDDGPEDFAHIYSPESQAGFGSALGGMGDVDGDGFDDAAISAPGSRSILLYLNRSTGFETVGVPVVSPTDAGFGRALACRMPWFSQPAIAVL